MIFGDMKSPWFLALDMDSKTQALQLAQEVRDFVGGFKIGSRLILREGRALMASLAEIAPVFVDQKYFDIPNTMEHSIRATFEAGASFATVHAAAGAEALRRLAEVEKDLNVQRPFKILAVTVLTSFSQNSIPPHWQQKPLEDHVLALAQEAISSGLSGLVCSPHEVEKLRQAFPHAFLVTPGVRMATNLKDDQKRVATPQEALRAGSSALVVGRPVYQAPDPIAAAQAIYTQVKA